MSAPACGCDVNWDPGWVILYCPTHAAAFEMLEILLFVLNNGSAYGRIHALLAKIGATA